jgi:hypothetical protein
MMDKVDWHLYPALMLAFQNTRLESRAQSDHPQNTRATHNTVRFLSRPHRSTHHGPRV